MTHFQNFLTKPLLLIFLSMSGVSWWLAIDFLSKRDYISGLVLCMAAFFTALIGREFGILSMAPHKD